MPCMGPSVSEEQIDKLAAAIRATINEVIGGGFDIDKPYWNTPLPKQYEDNPLIQQIHGVFASNMNKDRDKLRADIRKLAEDAVTINAFESF